MKTIGDGWGRMFLERRNLKMGFLCLPRSSTKNSIVGWDLVSWKFFCMCVYQKLLKADPFWGSVRVCWRFSGPDLVLPSHTWVVDPSRRVNRWDLHNDGNDKMAVQTFLGTFWVPYFILKNWGHLFKQNTHVVGKTFSSTLQGTPTCTPQTQGKFSLWWRMICGSEVLLQMQENSVHVSK